MFMDHVIDQLKKQGRNLQALQPCTEQEIQSLEQDINVRLPAAYRAFLLLMGHDGDEILRGTDCFYPDLPHIQGWARTLLHQNQVTTPLPPDAFVFLYHGYQFMFFRISEGDNPPVYHYLEGNQTTETFPQTFPNFTHFLLSVIEE